MIKNYKSYKSINKIMIESLINIKISIIFILDINFDFLMFILKNNNVNQYYKMINCYIYSI